MSNARIVERLEALAGQLDRNEITLREFASEVPGHTTALDNLEYRQIKEAQLAAVELGQMADLLDDGMDIDRLQAVQWLRQWIAEIPV